MATDTSNTNQHYVPKMLLRGFTTEGSSVQVHVFDKRTGKNFTSGIDAVAAEFGYYDFGSSTLDGAMTRADGITSGIINEIRNRRSLAGLSGEDREMLTGFVVLQYLRTRGYQESMRHMVETLATGIKEKTGSLPSGWPDLTAEQFRAEYLHVIPQFTRDFLPHLLDKNLLLFRTDRSAPFCISDNPVTLTNTVNSGDGVRGTRGFAVEGIEIYLPISTELTLAFHCPSIGQRYELDNWRLSRLGGFLNEYAFYYLQARDMGKAMLLKPENVRFQNSLQIISAERFVVSSRDDFADAADIVARHPRARIGPRVTAS